MKTHSLKTWPDPFEAMLNGTKTFEIRKDDRGYEVGDLLDLREWDPGTELYSGRRLTYKVTHIERGPAWGLPPDLVVMGLGHPFTLDDMAEVAEMLTGETFEVASLEAASLDRVLDHYGGALLGDPTLGEIGAPDTPVEIFKKKEGQDADEDEAER